MLNFEFKSPFYSPEDDLSGGNEKLDNNESEDTENKNEETDETGEQQEKDDSIPKELAIKWKKEARELKRKLRNMEGKDTETEITKSISEIRDLCKEKGYDDDFADIFEAGFKKVLGSIPKKDLIADEVLEDLEDYDDLSGIDKKEIIEVVKRYRKVDPDFSTDDAIRLKSKSLKPSSKKELQTEIEQKNLLSRRNQEPKTPASGSTKVVEEYPLTSEERKTLKGLQQARPDRGWTPKKFYETMKKKE